MILIGTMDWASTRMRGMFACPNCGATEAFRLRASRPFLTLYFIPVLPIGALQEYVQCSRCKTSFETEILASRMLSTGAANGIPTGNNSANRSTSAAAPAVSFDEDLLKLIALMMVEDGHVTENEIRLGRRLFENMTEQNLSREQLGQTCSQVRLQRLNTLSFLSTARQRRNHEEKLLMVLAMFGVAGADGEISPGRLKSLVEAQETLQLDKSEFERAVASTEQWLT